MSPVSENSTTHDRGSRKICRVISDLHIFSNRSRIDDHYEEIRAAAASCDIFVFNGDTFDFKWTTLPSIDRTVEAAIEWVDRLAVDFPKCDFQFVLGNHDYHGQFIRLLDDLADRRHNVFCHPFYLSLGDALFLHGDAANRNMSAAALVEYRNRHLEVDRKKEIFHNIYKMVVDIGAHKSIYLVHSRKRLANRILSYLDEVEPILMNDIQHIYFGHTHVPFSDFDHRGFTFHNTGSMIRGLNFQMIETHIHC